MCDRTNVAVWLAIAVAIMAAVWTGEDRASQAIRAEAVQLAADYVPDSVIIRAGTARLTVSIKI